MVNKIRVPPEVLNHISNSIGKYVEKNKLESTPEEITKCRNIIIKKYWVKTDRNNIATVDALEKVDDKELEEKIFMFYALKIKNQLTEEFQEVNDETPKEEKIPYAISAAGSIRKQHKKPGVEEAPKEPYDLIDNLSKAMDDVHSKEPAEKTARVNYSTKTIDEDVGDKYRATEDTDAKTGDKYKAGAKPGKRGLKERIDAAMNGKPTQEKSAEPVKPTLEKDLESEVEDVELALPIDDSVEAADSGADIDYKKHNEEIKKRKANGKTRIKYDSLARKYSISNGNGEKEIHPDDLYKYVPNGFEKQIFEALRDPETKLEDKILDNLKKIDVNIKSLPLLEITQALNLVSKSWLINAYEKNFDYTKAAQQVYEIYNNKIQEKLGKLSAKEDVKAPELIAEEIQDKKPSFLAGLKEKLSNIGKNKPIADEEIETVDEIAEAVETEEQQEQPDPRFKMAEYALDGGTYNRARKYIAEMKADGLDVTQLEKTLRKYEQPKPPRKKKPTQTEKVPSVQKKEDVPLIKPTKEEQYMELIKKRRGIK